MVWQQVIFSIAPALIAGGLIGLLIYVLFENRRAAGLAAVIIAATLSMLPLMLSRRRINRLVGEWKSAHETHNVTDSKE